MIVIASYVAREVQTRRRASLPAAGSKIELALILPYRNMNSGMKVKSSPSTAPDKPRQRPQEPSSSPVFFRIG